MLQENAVIGTVKTLLVLGIVSRHLLGIVSGLSEVGTEKVLVTDIRSEHRLSGNGFDPHIDIGTGDAGPVVVEQNRSRIVADEFEPVLSPVPIY